MAVVTSSFGDLWFELALDGVTLVPTYSDSLCARAAIAAYLIGDFGSLTTEEIAFFKMAGIRPTTND